MKYQCYGTDSSSGILLAVMVDDMTNRNANLNEFRKGSSANQMNKLFAL